MRSHGQSYAEFLGLTARRLVAPLAVLVATVLAASVLAAAMAIAAAYQIWRNGVHLTGPGVPTRITALAALAMSLVLLCPQGLRDQAEVPVQREPEKAVEPEPGGR